jgi:hypothetical protein
METRVGRGERGGDGLNEKWKQGWGEGREMDCKRTDEEEEM